MALGLEEFRAQYPLLDEYAFLDHAAVSPLGTCVVRATEEYLHKAQYGPKYRDDIRACYDGARAAMAALVGASPDEIAFVQNTAVGISMAAHGLPLRAGDEVILVDMEYPANVYPWLSLAAKGVTTRIVPHRRGGLDLETLRMAVSERTRVVAVSSVEFLSGYRTDLQAIGAFCRERGIYFVVDGIQSLGVIPMDVRACSIDLLATGGPKWLLGPRGQGFLFCRREIIPDIRPVLTGAGGVIDEDNYLQYNLTFAGNADRFHIGTMNTAGIVGLKASVEMLMAVGIANIKKRVMELTDLLIAGLQEHGYPIFSNLEPEHRSGIVTFDTPDAEAVHAGLYAQKVIVSLRSGQSGESYIRVSPHGYNNEGDIQRFLAALDRVAH